MSALVANDGAVQPSFKQRLAEVIFGTCLMLRQQCAEMEVVIYILVMHL